MRCVALAAEVSGDWAGSALLVLMWLRFTLSHVLQQTQLRLHGWTSSADVAPSPWPICK